MLRSLTLFLALTAFGAQAQGIDFDVASTPVGLVAVYQRANGEKYNLTFKGLQGAEYIVESRNGDTGEGSVTATSYYNATGQLTRRARANITWVFDPHDCGRVIGSCRYTATRSTDGREFRLERVTQLDGDGRYAYEIYGIGAAGSLTVENGEVETGKWGIPTAFKFSARRSSGESKLLELREP